jgi:chromate transporter
MTGMKIHFQLFITFAKIGMFTIGGGYAMIPMIEKEVVEKHKWIGREEFLDMIAMAQAAPGVFAINSSIFVGYKIRGSKGSISALLGCALPSFFIILLIAMFFSDFKSYPDVERSLKGIRPVVVALIAAPMLRIAQNANLTWKTILIPILGTIAIFGLGISPMIIIVTGIVGGVVWGVIRNSSHEQK